jgi:hypothetical protein
MPDVGAEEQPKEIVIPGEDAENTGYCGMVRPPEQQGGEG